MRNKPIIIKGKCQLCGESCKEHTTIRNRISGKELKICNQCMEKYQFKQEEQAAEN